jgi:hypothetical protein
VGQQSRQLDGRPVGQIKGYSHEKSTQKKELLTLALGDVCIWAKLKSMKMMMGENQSRQSQVYVTTFRGTEG